ncbi:STAS domain-containing protein [Streptomyces sp. NPDC049970]|uniref:STAS domain-containing protein n=1 Tax=Streptomyces sp. NPDC049970 TaxID=3155033 RepID=UPI003412A61A
MPDHALVLTMDESPAGSVVLRLAGTLDHLTADRLRRAVEEAIPRAREPLVLEMSRLVFCDSVGISEIVFAHREALAAGTSLHLVGVGRELTHLFELTGVDQVLTLPQGADRVRPVDG